MRRAANPALLSMAVYTELTKQFLSELAEDYGFGRVIRALGIREGSVNTNYLLETAKGKFLARVDEVKSENELRREIDLLGLSAQARIPLPASRCRTARAASIANYAGKCVSVYKYQEGRIVAARAAASLPARNRRPRARAAPRDRQGVQEGDRQSLQLRAHRGPVPQRAQPPAQLLPPGKPDPRRRGRVLEPLPRRASCPRALSMATCSPTTCCFAASA